MATVEPNYMDEDMAEEFSVLVEKFGMRLSYYASTMGTKELQFTRDLANGARLTVNWDSD